MQNLCKILIILSASFYCVLSVAYPAGLDPKQPISIQANEAYIEQIKQEATYSGNVLMTQGENELRSDKLVIQKNAQGKLDVIKATGNPAHFKGKRENDLHPLNATANIIYYYPDKQLIVLEGSATLEHQQDKFEGPSLSYYMEKQVISATSQNDSRPTVILHPRG